MKTPYLIPSVVLFVTILGLGKLTSNGVQIMRDKADAVAQLQSDLADKQQLLATEKITYATLQRVATPGTVFAKQWAGILVPGRDANGNSILGDMSTLGTEDVVSVQGRRSGSFDYMWHDKPRKAHYAESKATSDDYYRLMNFLGGLEQKWPEARFETVILQRTGASLELSLRLAYPAFLTDPTSAQ